LTQASTSETSSLSLHDALPISASRFSQPAHPALGRQGPPSTTGRSEPAWWFRLGAGGCPLLQQRHLAAQPGSAASGTGHRSKAADRSPATTAASGRPSG